MNIRPLFVGLQINPPYDFQRLQANPPKSTIGTSSLLSSQPLIHNKILILTIRSIIFEKELMYQIKKECALLISYGVSIENENKVIIELPNEKFEIELLSLDDDSIVNHEQDLPKINDKRANLMLVMLRLLLVVIFKKTLRSIP